MKWIKYFLSLTGIVLLSSLTTHAQTKLTGDVIGDPLDGRERFAFDGDVSSFYDAGGTVGTNHGWLGYVLDNSYVINKVRYHPRVDGTNTWPCEKMLGGQFQGSNSADFSSPVTLATITTLPTVNAWGELAVTNTTAFKYVRYLAPDLSANTTGQTSSNLTVAELEFYTSSAAGAGGKKVYIPADWKIAANNIPWDSTVRSKQSANFAVFWGPLAGDDPTQATNAALRFNPQTMLDSMENVYDDYITRWKMMPDSGNLAKYKMVIVMNNTWRDGLYTGYLFGGGFDNVIGAMFIDPAVVGATDNWGLSHEFAHACQYMITNVLYPGHGFNDGHSGFFWETHAQFMASQRHPNGLGNADPARAMNFTTYTMSSPRKHYANFYYLQLLKDKYGLDFISRLWREADYSGKHEHPFQTIARLLGGQKELNTFFMEHAMRNVTWDYSTQSFIKDAMNGLGTDLDWRSKNILDSLGDGYYAIPDRLAPQQYGYNIVQLYVKDSGCTTPYIHLKFKGHTDANASSGWLYGFVTVMQDGSTVYSDQYADAEVAYQFPAGAKEYYMVVMGAPSTFRVHTDLFEIGFPKEFRYAWEVRMKGMAPQGYQHDFHGVKGIAGAPHSNGGGFVAASAHVDASAYVAPGAAVLDNASVTGSARIEGKATIRQFAVVSDNAVVGGFADVYGNSVIKENARAYDHVKLGYTTVADSSRAYGSAAVMYANISGGAAVNGVMFTWGGVLSNGANYGGDAEIFGPCANRGLYLQADGVMGRTFCDGSTDNYANKDTNAVYSIYGEAAMSYGKLVECGVITGIAGTPPVVNAGADQEVTSAEASVTLNGTATSSTAIAGVVWIKIAGPADYTITDSSKLSTTVTNLAEGVYQFKLVATDNGGNQGADTVVITVLHANIPPVANAGTDVTITLPDNEATVIGTATDPDGVVKAVAWTQASGPSSAYIVSAGSLTGKMDNLVEGVYVFVLTVTDNNGATHTDSVTVTVKKAVTGTTNIRITRPTLFPVPASDEVFVSYPATIGGVLSVYDSKGAKVFSKNIPPNTTSDSFSVKSLTPGVYFVRIDTYSDDKYKLKLIVAH